MKTKKSNKLFIIFSISTLIIGVIAFKYLLITSRHSSSNNSQSVTATKSLDASCFSTTEDPFVTKVDPNCN